MINESNIFERGMLIHLTMGGYAGRSKLPESEYGDLPKEIVRGVFDLFDKEFATKIDAIHSHAAETRNYLKRKSVPFPIDGVFFIASNLIEGVIEYMEQRKQERLALIEETAQFYEDAIKTFAEKYPRFYEKAKGKYLSTGRFKERFYFKYQFIKITAPENDLLISPEAYKKEMEKFRETINDMKRDVLSIIYSTLLDTTERLKKQATDGKLNQGTFNNLGNFLSQIDEVYKEFVDREDLLKVIQTIKKQMAGVSAEQLRDSESAKEKFRKGISAIAKEIKNLPDMPMKRAMDF